jgi:hypothetical protein
MCRGVTLAVWRWQGKAKPIKALTSGLSTHLENPGFTFAAATMTSILE